MFVPAPVNNYRLFVDFNCGGRQRYDLFQQVTLAHQENRFSGYEPLVLAFSNSIHYFEHAAKLRGKLNGPIKNDLYFSIIEHSARNYIRVKHHCDPQDLKLLLMVSSPDDTRVYFN
jgi:hypothetical protein